MATIQFRLAFKDKGHKSLEHCCLVIHLTSVISTISNAESNGGIFILIGPLGIYKYTMKRTAKNDPLKMQAETYTRLGTKSIKDLKQIMIINIVGNCFKLGVIVYIVHLDPIIRTSYVIS